MMKKIFSLLLLVMMLGLSSKISAQPAGEGWVTLQEAINNKLVVTTHQGMPYGESEMIDLYNFEPARADYQVFIEEIAVKNNSSKNYISNPKLILQTVEGMDGLEFKGSDQTSVNEFMEVKTNGKKFNKKNVSKDDNGWTHYKFDDLQRILYIGEFRESPKILNEKDEKKKEYWLSKYGDKYASSYFDYPLFSNIYVKLGDGSQYTEQAEAFLIEQYQKKIEEEKAAAVRERQERLAGLYTTPQEKGWSPVKSETLKDGTVVEHYSQGIRFIKKPNGDFASFIEPEDKRDPKTLDMIKGYDLPLDSEARIIGDFQMTFANGVIGKVHQDNEEYISLNGEKIRFNTEYIKQPQNLNDDEKYFSPMYSITYQNFISPSSSPEEFFIEGAEPNYINLERTPSYKMLIYTDRAGNDKYLNVYYNQNKGTAAYAEPVKPYSDELYVYRFDNNGLTQSGVFLIKEGRDRGFLPVKTKLKEVLDGKYVFENGDYLNYEMGKTATGKPIAIYKDAFITLEDGTTIERIEDKYRIKRPDGSKYVGSLFLDDHGLYHGCLISAVTYYIERGKKSFDTGYFTNAKGQEEEYNGGKNLTHPEVSNKDEVSPEQQALFDKYGSNNVLNAQFGIIKVGMPLELIRLYWTPSYSGSSGGVDTYTLRTNWGALGSGNHWRFRVNKKTGKVTSVTKLNS